MPRVVDVDERRRQLAEAAARLIARAGVEAATLRDVAAEAGWTTGALTHYFADKRELLLFTFKASLAGRHAFRDRPDERTPEELMIDSLEGALPLDEERRRHWMVTIAFCAMATGDRELSEAQRDAYRDFRAHLAAMAWLVEPQRDPAVLAEELIAAADGIALQALFDPAGWPPARQLSTLHELIARILRSARPGEALLA